jgi:two-component system chemotaxis response regulator CheY
MFLSGILMLQKNFIKTALAVDDNEDILSLFTELLELKNFNVVGKARDGNESLQLYEELRPDLTFLDVVMPNADGIYALSCIRKIDPEAVVIMVTTDLSRDTAKELANLKPTAIIYKPFDINELVKIVNDVESKTNISQIKFSN